MKSLSSWLWLILPALVFGLGTASPSLASCVYNKSYAPIEVDLHCGAGCYNHWIIHVEDHKCRPGKGGKVTVWALDPSTKVETSNRCEVKVDDHGWVTVYQDGKKIAVKSRHKDGSIREECHKTVTPFKQQ